MGVRIGLFGRLLLGSSGLLFIYLTGYVIFHGEIFACLGKSVKGKNDVSNAVRIHG